MFYLSLEIFTGRETSVSQRKMGQISRNKRGNSVDLARNLRGECNQHNPFFCLNTNARDINVTLTILYLGDPEIINRFRCIF